MKAKPRHVCEMGVYCREHDHVHGHEAEQLRKGIEKIIANSDTIGSATLQRLLDSIDANDSLAFLESKVRKMKEPKR